MTTPDPEEKPLPQFRKDLQLYRGPDEEDGTPTFNVYDPVKVQYYKISWAESIILQHLQLGMTLSQLIEEVERRSTLKVTKEEVVDFFMQAQGLNLLAGARPSEMVEKEAELTKIHPIKWFLTHYLFFRIPLLKPDPFLEKTLPWVMPLVSKPAMMLYTLLSFIGIVMTFNRFEEYVGTFPYFFNLNGVIVYAIALTGVKVIHELAHAYTAKYYKTYVASMGVAFLVLWPVLYTDVTDSWKLASRRQRLWITGAGVLSEFIIAGLCTLGWALSEPGLWHSLFFVLSSASWLATLAININPAMRFDGYYLLSDLWGIDNLQPRSFAVTRWKLRKWLFGLELPPPEEGLSEQRVRGMVIYSFYTWIYRLILYTTIAIFVYYTFTKALGIFLFVLEIGLLIVWPILSEFQTLYRMRGSFRRNVNIVFTFLVALIFLGWFVIPLPRTKWFSALTVPIVEQVLYVPLNSQVENIFVERGVKVKRNQPLIQLYSEYLSNQIRQFEAEQKVLDQQIHYLSLQKLERGQLPGKQKELEGLEEQLRTLQAQAVDLTIRAELDGVLYLWDQNLQEGQYLRKDLVLGKIADISQAEILCYVPEHLIGEIFVGQKATMMLTNSNEKIAGVVREIDPTRDELLTYSQLASEYGGDLAVSVEDQGRFYLLKSYYPVKISINEQKEPLQYGLLGDVKVTTRPRSKLVTLFRWMLSLIWRESGL